MTVEVVEVPPGPHRQLPAAIPPVPVTCCGRITTPRSSRGPKRVSTPHPASLTRPFRRAALKRILRTARPRELRDHDQTDMPSRRTNVSPRLLSTTQHSTVDTRCDTPDVSQNWNSSMSRAPNRRRASLYFAATPVDPVLRRLRKRRMSWPSVAVVFTFLFFVPLITAAAISESLWAASVWSLLGTDIRVSLLPAETHLSVTLESIPLLRDIWTLGIAATAILTVTIVYVQWQLMGRLFIDLEKKRILRFNSRVRFQTTLQGTNRFLKQYGWFTAAVLSLITTFLALREMAYEGILPGLAAAAGVSPQANYAAWWAGHHNRLGITAYAGLTYIYNYYIALQNIVGITLIILLVRQATNIRIDYNLTRPDKYYGWLGARRLLLTVYISIMNHAVAIALLLVLMPSYSITSLPIVFGIFLLLNPLFVLLPIALIARKNAAAKQALIQQATGDIERQKLRVWKQTGSALDRAAQLDRIVTDHARKVEVLEGLPLIPFRWRETLPAAAAYASFVSLALSLVALVR